MERTVSAKVMRYTQIAPQDIPSESAKGTKIRWLITKEDGAPNFAMRYFTVEPGGEIYDHSHPWEHEIFITRGKGKVKIGDTWYDVESGYFLFVPPNAPHEYKNTGDEPLEFICIIPHTK